MSPPKTKDFQSRNRSSPRQKTGARLKVGALGPQDDIGFLQHFIRIGRVSDEGKDMHEQRALAGREQANEFVVG